MTDTEKFEPMKNYRWVVESPRFESNRLYSVRCHAHRDGEIDMFLGLLVMPHTDVTVFPFPDEYLRLKLLDSRGEVWSKYRVTWQRRTFTPFESLCYSCEFESDARLTQSVTLFGVTMSREKE